MADPWAAFKPVQSDPWSAFKPVAAQQPVVQTAVAEEAATPAESTWSDTLMSALGYADATGANLVRGARRGVAGVAGLPVDLMNAAPMLGNLLPGEQNIGPMTENPFMGSEFVDQALGGFGMLDEPPEPVDVVQRSARRIGQELGATAVPVAGAVAAGARLGVQGARQLPGIARMFVEPAAVNPGRFIQKEALVATGAGQGAAVANEMVPDSPTADLIGAITGAGAMGAAGMMGTGIKNVANAARTNKPYIDEVVQQTVADRLINAAGIGPNDAPDTTDLVAAISGGPRVAQTIPGFEESLADRTGNAGLAALEYSRQAGKGAGQFVTRRGNNTDAVENAMSALEPQATPGAFRSALADERDLRIMDANQRSRQAQDAANAAVAPLQPRTTRTERGNVVRTALEEQRDAARARTDEAYSAIDVEGRQVDPAQLTDTLDSTLAGMTEVERTFVPQNVIERIMGLGRTGADIDTGLLGPDGRPITRPDESPEPVSLQEASDLRTELNRLRAAAIADPRAERGGRKAARVLGRLSTAVDNFITGNLDETEVEALTGARGAKFEEAEAFTRAGDPVAAALARQEGGRPRMSDERVAGSFVPPQSMDRLFAQADSPQVRAAIRDELLSRADTGSVEGVQQFTADHAEQLARFPGLRGELEAAGQARGVERVATAAETGIVREIGQEGRGTVAKYLQYDDDKAEQAIGMVLANKKPGQAADELLTFVNDSPEAAEGARAALWKVLRKKSQSVDVTQRSVAGNQAWRGDWLNKFLNEPATASVIERFYRDQPEQLQRIRQIADVLSNVDLRQRGKAAGTSGTGQAFSQVMSPETMQSRTWAYMRGQVSGTYLVTSILAVMARRSIRKAQTDAIDMLTDKALLEPDVAAQLLKENNPANRAALARKAKLWFGNEASTIINMVNEDDEDPVVKAATAGPWSNARFNETAGGR